MNSQRQIPEKDQKKITFYKMRYWAKIEDQNRMVFKHPKSKKKSTFEIGLHCNTPQIQKKTKKTTFQMDRISTTSKVQKKNNF